MSLLSKALFPLLLSFLTLNATAAKITTTPEPAKLEQKARLIHRKILTFDSHVDVPTGLDASLDGKSQIDLAKVERGHLSAAALAVFVNQAKRTPENYAKAKEEADAKYQTIVNVAKLNPNRAALAYSPSEVRDIAKHGKFAVVISFLNAFPLGTDLSQIDAWYDRGVRIFGFNHAGNNDWADSSRPNAGFGDRPDEAGGLTDLGKRAVQRLNEKGILIDVSQLSSKALADTLALTKSPVAATHSGVKGVIDNSRNLSDDELRAIAKNGGVVQIVAFSNYLRPIPADVQDKVKALRSEYGLPTSDDTAQKSWPVEKQKEFNAKWHEIIGAAPKATLSQLVDSIDYAVKLIGIDHVGIASDFNHGGGVVGWNDEGEAPNVTVELLRRGYSESQIEKLWGGNFLRVWAEAQKNGRQLAAKSHRSAKQAHHA